MLKLVTERQLAAAALLAPDVAPTRSELERRFRRLMRRAGLPQPRTNTLVAGREADFTWPELGVVVETDGWGAHGPAGRSGDRAARGYVVALTPRRARLAPVLRRRQPQPREPAAA